MIFTLQKLITIVTAILKVQIYNYDFQTLKTEYKKIESLKLAILAIVYNVPMADLGFRTVRKTSCIESGTILIALLWSSIVSRFNSQDCISI